MQINEFISQLEAVAEFAIEGKELEAWDATIPLQQDIIKCLREKIPVAAGFTAEKPTDEHAKKINKLADKIIAACPCPTPAEPEEGKPTVTEAPPFVPTLEKLFPGDGSFLRNFAEFLKVVIPLIITFIPK